MKRLFICVATGIITLLSTIANAAGNDGDRILGEYKAVKDGAVSKVRISKTGENTYRAQVFWLDKETHADGTLRKDSNNPDPTKRNTPSNQIVLIERICYNSKEKVWKDGSIYDPIKGDLYRVVLDFEGENLLRVRGYLGPFSKSLYWEKIN